LISVRFVLLRNENKHPRQKHPDDMPRYLLNIDRQDIPSSGKVFPLSASADGQKPDRNGILKIA
jgi:hypothetical protein